MRLSTRLKYWWWRIHNFRAFRANEWARETQRQQFYAWARGTSPDISDDLWEQAKAIPDVPRWERTGAGTNRHGKPA